MLYTLGCRLINSSSSISMIRRSAGLSNLSTSAKTFQSVLNANGYRRIAVGRSLYSTQSGDQSGQKTTGNQVPIPDPSRPHHDQGTDSKRRIFLGVGLLAVGGAALVAKKLLSGDDKASGTAATGKHSSLFDRPPTKQKIELPGHVQYLIVGAGTAAFAAYRAIRAGDANAQVLMVGEETYKPYQRPPLSKELWYSDDKEAIKRLHFKLWNGKERSIFYEKEGFYCTPTELVKKDHGGVSHAPGVKVMRLDVTERKAYLEDGRTVSYDKCLIATGGRPRNLPVIEKAGSQVLQRTTLFRNVDDFKQLYDLTSSVKSLAIIGGGFLGSELACALGKRGLETGMKVTQVFPESGNMGMVLPEYLSRWATGKVQKEGVDVMTGATVSDCSYDAKNKKVVLKLSNDKQLSVDHVIVAVGLQPNSELAESSGLERDPQLGGFLVNAELQARANVWVAGDAACFYDVKLGRRRVEHHDHAVVSGRLAGENMTGAGKPYWHQSMFWSDLGPEVGYEAIGLVDSRLETVSVFAVADEKDTPREREKEEGKSKEVSGTTATAVEQKSSSGSSAATEDYGKGVIFYLRDGTIVGLVMWNLFNKMPIARQLIKEGKKYDDFTEVAKLFNLYGEPEVEAKKEEKQETKKKEKETPAAQKSQTNKK